MHHFLKSGFPLFLMLLLIPCLSGIATASDSQYDLAIAMVLWRGETEAELGFKNEMQTLGYRVQYTVFDARQDKSRLNSLLRQSLDPKTFDYIYTFGTTVSLQTKNLLKERVPHVFNIVSYPLHSGLVKSLEATGANICGVKSDVPLLDQVQNGMAVLPFKQMGVLFNPREKNSTLTLDELEVLGREFNFKVIAFRTPPTRNRLELNIRKIIESDPPISVVFLPADSFITSQAPRILKSLNRAGISTIGASHKLLTEGALLGSVADYYTLGQQAAKIVDRNQKGEPLAEIPVALPHRRLVINRTTMEHLGLDLQPALIKTVYIE